jgi:small subunit ribosomal protein S1
LGLKQTEENPWDKLANEYAAESKATGKVSKITDFGAFVEIMPGVEGLVHISELSEQRVRSVGDVVQEGQEVEVRVLKIDRAAQRVSLSMKPEPKVSAHAGADSKSPKKRKKPLRGGLSNPSIGDDDSPVSGLRLGQ